MTIDVRLFAILRQAAGAEDLQVDVPDGATVAVAVAAVLERYPGLRRHARYLAFAVNQSYAKADAVLNDGDELALIPPVSGG
jgi:molybdopterin converting factor subunit 1